MTVITLLKMSCILYLVQHGPQHSAMVRLWQRPPAVPIDVVPSPPAPPRLLGTSERLGEAAEASRSRAGSISHRRCPLAQSCLRHVRGAHVGSLRRISLRGHGDARLRQVPGAQRHHLRRRHLLLLRGWRRVLVCLVVRHRRRQRQEVDLAAAADVPALAITVVHAAPRAHAVSRLVLVGAADHVRVGRPVAATLGPAHRARGQGQRLQGGGRGGGREGERDAGRHSGIRKFG